jgi:hypothetical protein
MWKNQHQFRSRLRKRGYHEIGAGMYGCVMAHPDKPDKVIKVGKGDDCWPLYIQWAAEHGELGKRAPNVTSLKVINTSQGEDATFYVAVMERLVCTAEQARRDNEFVTYKDVLAPVSSYPLPPDWRDYVAEVTSATGGTRDIHAGNWMVRKDGTIVLTDPVSGSSSSSGKVRIKSGSPAPAQLAA